MPVQPVKRLAPQKQTTAAKKKKMEKEEEAVRHHLKGSPARKAKSTPRSTPRPKKLGHKRWGVRSTWPQWPREDYCLRLNVMDMLGGHTWASHPNFRLLQDLEGSTLTQGHNKVCFARGKKNTIWRLGLNHWWTMYRLYHMFSPLDTLTVSAEVCTMLVWADVRHTFLKNVFIFIFISSFGCATQHVGS